jgi:hypothetical protein
MKTLFYMNARCPLTCLLIQAMSVLTACSEVHAPKAGVSNEMVMPPGMSITATNQEGTITITAGRDFKRNYTWDGETRSVTLWPRWERWYGSLGAYYPGAGQHWRNNHGITRGVLEEGQQHFETIEEALKWIRLGYHVHCVYRDDGLMVCWGRTLARKQLNVEVWQIYIAGHKPTKLEGSDDNNITVILTE